MTPQVRSPYGSASTSHPLQLQSHGFEPTTESISLVASCAVTSVKLRVQDEETSSWITKSWAELISLHQDLGSYESRELVKTFRDYACWYGADLAEDVEDLPGQQLEIRSLRENSAQQTEEVLCTWTHIEQPSKYSIEWAAIRTGLDAELLARYLASEPGLVIRSSTCSVTRTYELTLPRGKDDFGKAAVTTYTMICGDDFLITFSTEPASEIQRLWGDIQDKRIHPRDCCSSSDIARSLVEATSTSYQHRVEELSARIEDFWQIAGSRIPTKNEILLPSAIRKDIELCRRFAHRFDDALGVVDLREELAGRGANNTLNRIIIQTLKEVGQSLTRCEQVLRDGLSTWSSLEDRWRNETLARQTENQIRYLPAALWAAIGGMNFAKQMPDWILYGGLVVAYFYGAFRSNAHNNLPER